MYCSAVGPCQAPARTAPSSAVSSSATAMYSVLREFHAPAEATREPGPGPLDSSAEWSSGGKAIQIGAVIVVPARVDALTPTHLPASSGASALVEPGFVDRNPPATRAPFDQTAVAILAV